jgi:hypothetical protein
VKETPQPDSREQREKELAKLAARRKRWLDAYDEERISKQEFNERMDKVAAAHAGSPRRHRGSGTDAGPVPHVAVRGAAAHAQARSAFHPGDGRSDSRSHVVGRIPGGTGTHQFRTALKMAVLAPIPSAAFRMPAPNQRTTVQVKSTIPIRQKKSYIP